MMYVGIAGLVLLIGSSLFLLFLELKKRRATGKSATRRSADYAMVQLNQQLRRTPKDAALIAKRGVLRLKKEDVPGAIVDFNQALELDGALAEPHYYLGMIHYSKKNFRAAAKEFQWIETNSEDTMLRTAVQDRLTMLRAKKYI
jgi:Flp pilus assembly protein TadD